MDGIYGFSNASAAGSYYSGFSSISKPDRAAYLPTGADDFSASGEPSDKPTDAAAQLAGKIPGFGSPEKSFDDLKIAGLKKETSPLEKMMDQTEGCQTCDQRKYQDGSNDPGVSFKTPTKIGPGESASAVAGHENEHVVREQAKAQREDREVVSQSVSYSSAVCPECHRNYVSGGLTRTVTRGKRENPAADLAARANGIGRQLDALA